MDNKISSIVKRSLTIIKSYIGALIIFSIFTLVILELESAAYVIPWFSFIVFIMLFFMIYAEMRNIGYKEKRPQYNINPSASKGLIYGFIGILPILFIQAVILIIKVPVDYETLRRRIFQLASGPVYWIAKVLGGATAAYMIATLSIVIITLLGYLAGHREFYMSAWIRNTFGIKKVKKR